MGGLKDKLKLTFAVFLIAAASLSGIPPFSGFWSKDAVLARPGARASRASSPSARSQRG